MSAIVRRAHTINQVLHLITHPQFLSLQYTHYTYTSIRYISTHSSSISQTFDVLSQFAPLKNLSKTSNTVINSNERRKIMLGLGRMIKREECEFLNLFSMNFCPYLLVKILRLLGDRETAFSFFKFSFCDDSEESVLSCCLACHVLAREGSRYLAQDMITWIILKIGGSRCGELVEWMWTGHWEYESDFSVLDSLMRGFLNVGMAEQAVEIVGKMREVGLVPSLSAISSLFRLLFRVGGYCSVWKLFRDMIRRIGEVLGLLIMYLIR